MSMHLYANARWCFRHLRDAAAPTLAVVAMAFAGGWAHAVPNPTIVGPIAATATPGDTSRNYPFLATNLFPVGSGYVEEEFFMEGTANRYSTSCTGICQPAASLAPVTVVSTGHPYRIRLVVRRPSDPAKFNGYVIVEWQNVSGQFELDVQWYRASEYYIRNGFAYVGVGPQRVGVHAAPNGLRAWNPARYGTLDVTAGGTFTDDSLKWDIFSQAGQAIANPVGVDPLGRLPLQRTLIATGDSQSSSNIATYLNTVHRLEPIYPGAVLAGPLGIPTRPDVTTKILKVPSEWDVIAFESAIRQPDSATLVSWEVAGMSHSPYHTFTANAEVRYRDVGVTGLLPGPAQCVDPTRSRVHSNFVFHAAYDWMVRWLNGEQPPSMPSALEVAPAASATGDKLKRDAFGLASGGIRLPDVTAPAATNTGWNAGGKPPTAAGTCQQAGTFIPFNEAQLRSLYSNHADYVAKVRAAADASVADGFLLPEDADALVAEADASDVLAVPRFDSSMRVVEFFHPAHRRYFWTANAEERANLDFQGSAGGGWFRTGETFFAWPAGGTYPADASPVCRLDGQPAVGPASHFYSASGAECASLATGSVWVDEGTAFRARMTCGAADVPVIRLWRPGATTNASRHRFAVRDSVVAQTAADGFSVEGPVFCVSP